MDFIEKKKKEKVINPTKPIIEMYIPTEENNIKDKIKKKKNKKSSEKLKVDDEKTLDLSRDYKRRKKIIKILFWGIMVLVFTLGIVYLVYFLYTYQLKSDNNIKEIPIVINNEIVNIVETPIEAPSIQGALTNTPLKPISGSLIKFKGSNDIFLVEKNGELRYVVQNDVNFDNGQTISELNPNLIYLLPDKWKSIRKGSRNVNGQVDFDPRVLSLPELLPFL